MIHAAILVAFALTSSPNAEIARIARSVNGRVGVAASLLEGDSLVRFHATEHYPMQSVYKLPIAMWVMKLVERKKLRLEQPVTISKSDLVPKSRGSVIRDRHPEGGIKMTIKELLEFMLIPSDGTACDVLLRLSGGAAASTRFVRSIGIKDMVIATSEAEMAKGEPIQYKNWTTPDARVALMRALEGHVLQEGSKSLLLDMMSNKGTIGSRIKGLLPGGTVVAHKTGSSGTVNGMAAATNDAGIITLPSGRHMLLAAFVCDSRSDSATRDGTIARIAKACWDRWSSPDKSASPKGSSAGLR